MTTVQREGHHYGKESEGDNPEKGGRDPLETKTMSHRYNEMQRTRLAPTLFTPPPPFPSVMFQYYELTHTITRTREPGKNQRFHLIIFVQ